MKCRLALAFFGLLIPAVAAAQEKVSFPSTDGDLKGGTPTTMTGYLYKRGIGSLCSRCEYASV
jgi:hypothetical protein